MARAQQANVPVIGFLETQGDGGCARAHRGGRRGVALSANPFRGLAMNA
jgi:hypothetical protein